MRFLPALGLAVSVLAFSPLPAAAQGEPEFNEIPYAPGQEEIGRRFDESKFRYCIDRRDPDWQVSGEIADAISGALLLEPVRYVTESQIVLEDITKVYELLLKECDLHMGFKLIPEGYEEWITLTRAYYETSYVYVTDDDTLNSLADLPAGRPIGATIGTQAHIQLVTYLIALPAAERWSAFPYGTGQMALEALANGTVDVVLVWAPEFWAAQQANPAYANLHIIDSNPLPPARLGVSALLLSRNTFMRAAIDEAIAALVADGTIKSILDEYHFPATAAP